VLSRRGQAAAAQEEAAKGHRLEEAIRKNPAPRL